jgi:hypothetical protein
VSSSSESEDSVSDWGEESEIDRINTKYSKRIDSIEDYKEKNELLSQMSIQNVMNKLDNGEVISKKEFETLKMANSLMDQDILKDKDTIERMKLYEDFAASVQREISDNNARIERHQEKLAEYEARLDELNEEDKMSSDDNSSNSNNESNPNNNSNDDSDGNNNDSNLPGPDQGPDQGSGAGPDDDGFDDFPPSFDFDDF